MVAKISRRRPPLGAVVMVLLAEVVVQQATTVVGGAAPTTSAEAVGGGGKNLFQFYLPPPAAGTPIHNKWKHHPFYRQTTRHPGRHPIINRLASSSSSSSSPLTTATKAGPWGGIDAKEFGAVGDGATDDAPALQRAINAALEQGRTLLLPAGHYVVNSTLNVMSSARAHYKNPGPGFAKHPLRLIGEGYLTRISAGRKMHAVLNFSSSSDSGRGPALPNPTENQYISDVAIYAASLANYSVFAPGIARSRFERVRFAGALSVGLSIGYGWCNYIEECYFGDNGVGLHTFNSANNIDVVDSIFEGNTGTGIYMSGGAQYNIIGNVLEGNGGPGIIVFGAEGVTISSNYYESNNDKSPTRWKNVLLRPQAHNDTNSNILVHADIVLNGAPSFHDGTSDWKHWQPLDWSSIGTPASLFYGSAYPPRAVVISGNTHAPHPNGSAVLLICGDGIVMTANEYGRRTPTGSTTNNVALVETGSDSTLFKSSNVYLKANTGWSSVSAEGDLVNQGLLRLLPTAQRYNGGVGVHTWAIEDTPPLYKPTNFLSRQQWTVPPSSCTLHQATGITGDQKFFNGAAVSRVGHIEAKGGCIVTFASFELGTDAQLRGQALYLMAQVNVSLPNTGISLLIDNGSGHWSFSSDADMRVGWQVYSYQMAMGVQGKARAGLYVHSTNAKASTSAAVVELGHTVMAPIGHEWTRL
jgi:parallel beta-helix repeat protein